MIGNILYLTFLASKCGHKSELQSFSQLHGEASVATMRQHLLSQDSITSSHSSTTTDTIQSKQKYLPPSDVSNPSTTSIVPVVEKHLNDGGSNKIYSSSSVVMTAPVSFATLSSPSQATVINVTPSSSVSSSSSFIQPLVTTGSKSVRDFPSQLLPDQTFHNKKQSTRSSHGTTTTSTSTATRKKLILPPRTNSDTRSSPLMQRYCTKSDTISASTLPVDNLLTVDQSTSSTNAHRNIKSHRRSSSWKG